MKLNVKLFLSFIVVHPFHPVQHSKINKNCANSYRLK